MADSRWNVKRGLNRLFVVTTVCWYVAAGVILSPRWNRVIDYSALAKQEGLEVSKHPPDEMDKLLATAPKAQAVRPVGLTVILLLVPPATYAVAIAVLWIVRGFQVDSDARR